MHPRGGDDHYDLAGALEQLRCRRNEKVRASLHRKEQNVRRVTDLIFGTKIELNGQILYTAEIDRNTIKVQQCEHLRHKWDINEKRRNERNSFTY